MELHGQIVIALKCYKDWLIPIEAPSTAGSRRRRGQCGNTVDGYTRSQYGARLFRCNTYRRNGADCLLKEDYVKLIDIKSMKY